MSYSLLVVIDVSMVVLALVVLRRFTPWSLFNPGIVYVSIHMFAITLRALQLYVTERPLPQFPGAVNMDLIARALVAADISLFAVTLAIACALRGWKRAHAYHKYVLPNGSRGRELNSELGKNIAIICILVGPYFLITMGAASRTQGAFDGSGSAFAQSSIPFLLGLYTLQGALILIRLYGTKPWTILLFAVILLPTSYQLPRFALVLGVLIFLLTYQRYPTYPLKLRRTMAVALPIICLWFVLKPLAVGLGTGADFGTITQNVVLLMKESILQGGNLDTEFLDAQACNMALIDETGKYFYGGTLLPLLYWPIPRVFWPEKPSLSQHIKDISTRNKPIGAAGVTPNISGESYLNGGWIGCFVIPGGLYWLLGRFYAKAISSDVRSIRNWFLITITGVSPLIFRDGLSALFLFPFVYYMPLTAFGVLSYLLPRRRRVSQKSPGGLLGIAKS